MELEYFSGEHYLSGVDIDKEELIDDWNYNKYADVVLFTIDGKTYKAIEDPNDGLRSYMNEIVETNVKLTNTFPPQKVIGIMKDNEDERWSYEENDIIQFFDTTTKKLVFELGTGNTNDYYPYCVMHWYPENLAINNK